MLRDYRAGGPFEVVRLLTMRGPCWAVLDVDDVVVCRCRRKPDADRIATLLLREEMEEEERADKRSEG